jgi:hypothetical protein
LSMNRANSTVIGSEPHVTPRPNRRMDPLLV